MKSFLLEMEKKFIQLEEETVEVDNTTKQTPEDELEEQNTTSAVAGYNVPGAFTTAKKFKKKKFTWAGGQVNESKHTAEDILEKKYEQLIEGYRDFKSGDVKPSSKVKSTIQEIAKKLQEIETLVQYNSKLKTESGVTSSAYGPATQKALSKISERLVKISERVRSLGE